MEAMAVYSLKAGILLLLFWGIYQFFLRKETFYRFNRYFLLAGIGVAFVVPFLTIRYPVEVVSVGNLLSAPSVMPETMSYALPESPVGVTETIPSYNWLPVLIYLFVFILLLLYRVCGLVKLMKYVNIYGYQLYNNYKLVKLPFINNSFSFFNYIIVSDLFLNDKASEIILKHEAAHVDQKHWIDLLAGNVICLLWWFNPVVWLYLRSIRENHEFLADNTVLTNYRRTDYLAVLVNKWCKSDVFPVANSFSDSTPLIRVKMMKKKVSHPLKKLVVLIALPLLTLFFWGFSEPEYIYVPSLPTFVDVDANMVVVEEEGNDIRLEPVAMSVSKPDTTPKEEWTPVTYTDEQIDSMIYQAKEFNRLFRIKGITDKRMVVIDGLEAPDALEHLPQEDLFSLSLMDEREAFRKYGKRAANGVFLVTTKKGRAEMLENSAINISGIVTDESDNPIRAATVAVRGTKTGTYTDEEGRFFLRVAPTDVVSVYADGYSIMYIIMSLEDIKESYVIRLKKETEE